MINGTNGYLWLLIVMVTYGYHWYLSLRPGILYASQTSPKRPRGFWPSQLPLAVRRQAIRAFTGIPRWSVEVYIIITHRIHGAGIYANIGGILMVNVTIYSIQYMGPMGNDD